MLTSSGKVTDHQILANLFIKPSPKSCLASQPHQPLCPLSVLSDRVTGDSPLCIVYIIPQHSTLFASEVLASLFFYPLWFCSFINYINVMYLDSICPNFQKPNFSFSLSDYTFKKVSWPASLWKVKNRKFDFFFYLKIWF